MKTVGKFLLRSAHSLAARRVKAEPTCAAVASATYLWSAKLSTMSNAGTSILKGWYQEAPRLRNRRRECHRPSELSIFLVRSYTKTVPQCPSSSSVPRASVPVATASRRHRRVLGAGSRGQHRPPRPLERNVRRAHACQARASMVRTHEHRKLRAERR